MKKFYASFCIAVCLCFSGLSAPVATAQTIVNDYAETFDTFDDSSNDCAPAYWLHNVDRGSDSNQYYFHRPDGGHDSGAYVELSEKCNPYYMTDDCLVTLPVKGAVSFYIKGASSSSVLEIYKMSFDGGKITKGSKITNPSGFKMSTEWQQVNITVDDYTRIGILLRKGGAIDDFTAESADKSDFVYMNMSNFVLPEKIVADVTGKATIALTFDLANKGTKAIEAGAYSFTAGVTNYLGSSFTSDLEATTEQTPAIAVGESAKISMDIIYNLKDASKNENASIGIKNSLTGQITKIASSSVTINSVAGVLNVKYASGNSTSSLSDGGKIELGVIREIPAKNILKLTNSGVSDIKIIDIRFDRDMEDAQLPALPITVAAGSEQSELAIVLPETAGGKSGNVTLVYSNGISNDNEFTYSVSCANVPADAWIEDFQSCSTPNLPKGWMVGEGSFRTVKGSYETNVYANGDQYKVSSLITSKMKLNKGGAITVQGVRQHATDAKKDALLTVYYSPDRVNWTEIGGVLKEQPSGRLPFNTFVANSGTTDWKWYNFSLKNIETGEYYVKFETAPFKIDNIFGMEPADVAHDMLISSFSADSKGEVNKELSATLTVTNMNDKADGDYSVTLFENGVAVAEQQGVEIEAYDSTEIIMSYMPHTAGNADLVALLNVADAMTFKSDTVSVSIAEEDNMAKISGVTIDSYSSDGLVKAKFNKLQFYVPASATGLTEGTQFSEIAFSVYYSASYGEVTIPYTLWIEEVDAESEFTNDDKTNFDLPDAASAIATGSYTLKGGESSKDVPAEFVIALDRQLTYTGKAYRFTMEMNLSSASYNFYAGIHKYDVNYGRFFGSNSATGTYPGASLTKNIPVVSFRYPQTAANVSGILRYNGKALAGAQVLLVEEQPARSIAASASAVSYSGVTDADGKFSISVIKSDRSYRLSAIVNDEYTYTHSALVAPEGNDVDLNTIEIKNTTTGISDAAIADADIIIGDGYIRVEGADACVYNMTGTAVAQAQDGETVSLTAGMYILQVTKNGQSSVSKIIVR